MEKEKWHEKATGKELEIFSIFSVVLMFVLAFVLETPRGIWEGMIEIVISRDALITDYFELTSYGAAFFNAAMVTGIAVLILMVLKMKFTGITMSVIFIIAGYSLWGKNPVNILPILIGTFLYAKSHGASVKRYIYTGLFGTCLAPFVTEVVYILPFSTGVNLLFAIGAGILIGYILPPLSMHTASMHMGYNLYNVGFAAGVLAFVLVCVMEAFGIESNAVFIWKAGRNPIMVTGLYIYFFLAFLYGLFINKGRLGRLRKVMKHPGRAVADFVLMDGSGTTLMNMGLMGIVCVTYIKLVKGDFSGPVVGAIFTAFGFAAFGAHLKNYLPVLLGVFLSTLITRYGADTPGIQLAACFAVGLAPIAGQFGIIAGVLAGMLHTAIVMCTSEMYGGLNLYNNGFSAGWVAIILVPSLESFMVRYSIRKDKIKKMKEQKSLE